MWKSLLNDIEEGNIRSLARAISLVENEYEGYETFLRKLPPSSAPIVGITGPPGAGKSTLTDALIGLLVNEGKKVAVVCIDPSSPFSRGAVLGDRIRMSQWYNHSNVFIRSLATRGSLGGLNPKILEITDILKAAPFDTIIVETVGVGQSEVEIAGLADTTVVVIVPEAGDDIQMMKAGLLEIADVFVVNKADRPDADRLLNTLRAVMITNKGEHAPVIKTVASQNEGIKELWEVIKEKTITARPGDVKVEILVKKAWYLLQQFRMKDVDPFLFKERFYKEYKENKTMNLYNFVYNGSYR